MERERTEKGGVKPVEPHRQSQKDRKGPVAGREQKRL